MTMKTTDSLTKPEMTTDLQLIGLRNGTDKADTNHTVFARSYLDIYDHYFSPVRDTARCVLEIGVHRGASLKTWRDYFPHAQVWGLDINPESLRDYGPRIHVVIGSQTDPIVIAKIAPTQRFDIIIDDGSHRVDHILASLKILWPHLNPGGYYVIEDLSLSYLGDISQYRDIWLGQNLNPQDASCFNDRKKLDQVLLARIAAMDNRSGDTAAIHFHPMQCFIRKAKTP